MSSSPSDEDLMRRVAGSRDEEAFTTLVRRHREEIIRHGMRMIGDYHRSEELAQEVFVRVYRKAGSFDPTRAFRSWVFTISTNLCRGELRRVANRPRSADRPAESAFESPAPDDIAEEVRRAVNKLPGHERETLILREFHGFRYVEIAGALDIPVNTVKIALHRARMRLLERLGGKDGEE
jgi:RNA polymerase sigma-70 factor (ECF subfamily)